MLGIGQSLKTVQKCWWAWCWVSCAVSASAADFTLDNGSSGRFNLQLTAGTQWRANAPGVDQYGAALNKVVTDVPKGRLTGFTGGSDLNYQKGKPISTVLKASFDAELRKDNWALFLSGLAWHDMEQGHRSVAYGNYPNQFTPNAPLSDHGFSSSAQFSGAQLRELYAQGRTTWGESTTLQTRVGRQLLDWGGSQLTPGGINMAVHPADYAAAVRPGVLANESRLPLGMMHFKLGTGTSWGYEGYWALESRNTEIPGCGTYFDVSAYSPQGCDFTAVDLSANPAFANFTENKYLTSGIFVHRNTDIQASGQHLGVAAQYTTDSKATVWKWYALDTSASTPSLRVTLNSAAMLGDPRRGSYANLYVDHIRLYGMSVQSQLNASDKVFGEITLRPNQVISYNATDLLSAFLLQRGPLALYRGALNVPVGGSFDAYERFRVVTGSLGASKTTAGLLGANRAVLMGEWAFSHVSGLPSPDQVRFGRPIAYGAAGYLGSPTPCRDDVAGKTCADAGYVTSLATSLRAYAALGYANLIPGAMVTPSLAITMDLSGYAYDGLVSQGRRLVRPGVRIDWAQSHFVEYQYNRFSGGAYNLIADRDFHSLVAGVRF
jgi:hypothetical protein